MQFKHPEILYFLFLLVIPILVHLFQLRRFKKEYFTNVRFLEQISIQTRKSSQIKKWLLLATRLLLLAFLILAFAQPYFSAQDSKNMHNSMYLVLDNSYSMQAKGQKGALLARAIEDLLEHIPEQQTFSLLTNTETFWDTDIKSIRRELQNLGYSPLPFQLESAMAKIKAHEPNAAKDIVVITDAVGIEPQQLKSIDPSWNTTFITPEPEQKNNVSVDRAFISQNWDNFYEIAVELTAYGSGQEVPVALYQGEKLMAKTIVPMKSATETVRFTIPKGDFQGYVTITDNALSYDNTYYLSISKPQKTHVLSIGAPEKSDFLTKIYTPDEFVYEAYALRELDYNKLEQNDAIILNELTEIPQALQTTLKDFVSKGGNLILIPATESKTTDLNQFLSVFGPMQMQNLQTAEKLITKISFNNPVFSSVFEKQVANFQYPKTQKQFGISNRYPAILSYEDQSAFLTSIPNALSNVYVFAAALNPQNSNFQRSPLIVPVFYNMAQSMAKTGVASYTIGENNPILVEATLGKDEIVQIQNEREKFIPTQQILSNKVKLICNEAPLLAGNYTIYQDKNALKNVSFNYSRTESQPNPKAANILSDFEVKPSVENFFDSLLSERTDQNLWKWLALLALLFLTLEILIQKLVK